MTAKNISGRPWKDVGEKSFQIKMLIQLQQQLENVRKLQELLQADPSHQISLIELNSKISEIEDAVLDYEEFILSEFQEKIDSEQNFTQKLDKQKQRLLTMWNTVQSSPASLTKEVPMVIMPEKKDAKKESAKLRVKIESVSATDFASIPNYIVGRLTLKKLNDMIEDLNIYLSDKLKVIQMPEAKMKQLQKDVLLEHRSAHSEDTSGFFYFTEKELKANSSGNSGFTKSRFNYGAQCKNILTILRTLGRIREVRGTGNVRYIIQN
jgi:hypothetical protein